VIAPTTLAPRGATLTRGRVRVLIVDDSVVIRHLLREALESDPFIEVVGAEGNGIDALARIPELKPDLVTLDIEMPRMDGLETLRRIRRDYPKLRTVMFSTVTTRGAAATFEALSLGADDYVAKASNAGKLDESLVRLRAELLPKIRQFFALPAEKPAPRAAAAPPKALTHAKPRVLAIGVSTGGPNALAKLLPMLPESFPLPVLIVQHMPATFTRLLAERLNAISSLQVVEAEERMEVAPGRVIVARGDRHLTVRATGSSVVTVLDDGPQENSCRPAVDVLFRSLAQTYRDAVLAVVLTGMGFDGRRGTEAVKAAGGYSIVQDQASSVVWGMPGAVAEAGLADRILPLDEIAPEVVRLAEPAVPREAQWKHPR
jgi:two-component system chemotaxis response regulator CheB